MRLRETRPKYPLVPITAYKLCKQARAGDRLRSQNVPRRKRRRCPELWALFSTSCCSPEGSERGATLEPAMAPGEQESFSPHDSWLGAPFSLLTHGEQGTKAERIHGAAKGHPR